MRRCKWCHEWTYVGKGWCLSRGCLREVGGADGNNDEEVEDTDVLGRETGDQGSTEPIALMESGLRREVAVSDEGGTGQGAARLDQGVEGLVGPFWLIREDVARRRTTLCGQQLRQVDDGVMGNRPRMLVGGERVWREFAEAVGLDEVRRIVLLDNHGVLNQMRWSEAVEVGTDLDHATAADGQETRLLMCSFARSDKWARRVFDSRDTLPMMLMLDGFVFVDSRDAGRGDIIAKRVTGKPSNWIWLEGGDKSAVSRLTGKPTLLFDDKRHVLREHSEGHWANEGVLCVEGREMSHVDQRYEEFRNAAAAETWAGYVQRFLDRE